MSRGDRSRPERERTHEERERDRDERARRRAQRAAGAADPQAPFGEPAVIPLPDPAEPAAPGLQPPAAISPDGFVPAPEPEPDALEPPAAPLEPLPEPAAYEQPPAPEALEPLPDDPVSEHVPPPATPPAPPAPPAAASAPPPPPALPASPFGPRPRVRHRRRSGPARVGAVIALLAAVAAAVLVARALVRSGRHTPSAAAPKVVKLLIPEGKTRAQIAEIAKTAGLSGSYLVASRRSPLLNPASYRAPHATPDLEGFLFPATYDVNPGEPASRLVQEQLIAFRENFGQSEIARARALHVTPYQLLTIASMIEREAQVAGDRAKIAAVIYNRLKQGVPLGIDATIYYAVEQRKGVATYTKELTEADLHIDSPYNTRTHTGLPPTPIANPGLASIQAAAHPARVSYLYYVAAADGCGEQVFSTTKSAFEANAAAYAAAVRKNGGHPPSCKHK